MYGRKVAERDIVQFVPFRDFKQVYIYSDRSTCTMTPNTLFCIYFWPCSRVPACWPVLCWLKYHSSWQSTWGREAFLHSMLDHANTLMSYEICLFLTVYVWNLWFRSTQCAEFLPDLLSFFQLWCAFTYRTDRTYSVLYVTALADCTLPLAHWD